jgi:hypothetical protein
LIDCAVLFLFVEIGAFCWIAAGGEVDEDEGSALQELEKRRRQEEKAAKILAAYDDDYGSYDGGSYQNGSNASGGYNNNGGGGYNNNNAYQHGGEFEQIVLCAIFSLNHIALAL